MDEYRKLPLNSDYPFLTVDATYFKVRENHRIVSKVFMIAYGTNANGQCEILGFAVYHNESKETCHYFLKGLKDRGLKGLLMITADAHGGSAMRSSESSHVYRGSDANFIFQGTFQEKPRRSIKPEYLYCVCT